MSGARAERLIGDASLGIREGDSMKCGGGRQAARCSGFIFTQSRVPNSARGGVGENKSVEL